MCIKCKHKIKKGAGKYNTRFGPVCIHCWTNHKLEIFELLKKELEKCNHTMK